MYIDDILQSMNKIQTYISGLEYEEFTQKDMVIDAVIRNLEIIGEASKNVPEIYENIIPIFPGEKW